MADNLRVSFIDVGKGDCVLIQTSTSSALIDAGYDNTADDVVAYLQNQGIERLDYLIITHYDKDHVGGVGAIADVIDIDELYLPGYEGQDKCYKTLNKTISRHGLSAKSVTKDLTLGLGDAELAIWASDVKFIPNANGDEGNDNDLSLVAGLTMGDDSYLFAGDLEEDGIKAYLKHSHGHFDVLKMPHHGRKSSNSDDFINDVQPKTVVITDSRSDPAQKQLLKLLENAGADVYRSSKNGTVIIESDGAGSYTVSTT